MSSATKSSDSKEYSIVEFNFKKWIGVLFKDGFSEPIDVTIADLSDVHEEDGDIFVTVENKRGKIVAQSGIYTMAMQVMKFQVWIGFLHFAIPCLMRHSPFFITVCIYVP